MTFKGPFKPKLFCDSMMYIEVAFISSNVQNNDVGIVGVHPDY